MVPRLDGVVSSPGWVGWSHPQARWGGLIPRVGGVVSSPGWVGWSHPQVSGVASSPG